MSKGGIPSDGEVLKKQIPTKTHTHAHTANDYAGTFASSLPPAPSSLTSRRECRGPETPNGFDTLSCHRKTNLSLAQKKDGNGKGGKENPQTNK